MDHYYIYCLHNENLPEYYVGHTVNLYDRNKLHRWATNIYGSKVYKYIKDNGGYNNFKMEVLDEIYCLEIEARQYEKFYKNLLGATLNTQEPGRTRKEYRDLNNPIYYENNKEQILEQKKERRHLCVCGANVRKNGQQKHFRTEKHINFIRENIGY